MSGSYNLFPDYDIQPYELTIDQVSSQGVALPVLKSTRNLGRVWQVAIHPNGLAVGTAYGVFNGKIQYSNRDVEQNKSGKSQMSQAILNANSLYNKKTASGEYVPMTTPTNSVPKRKIVIKSSLAKSSEPLPDDSPVDLDSDPDNDSMIDNGSTFRPMLAHEFIATKLHKLALPGFVQPKIDGVRCIAFYHELNGLVLSSRNRYGLYNRFAALYDFPLQCLQKVIQDSLKIKNIVFDGELVVKNESASGEENFQKTTSIARRSKGVISTDEEASLKYVLFTFFSPDAPKLTNLERFVELSLAFKACAALIAKQDTVVLIPHVMKVQSVEDVERAHKFYVGHKYEGTILYGNDGIYEVGKRSHVLLKLKDFNTSEGIIVGVISGKGREKDAAEYQVQVRKPDGKLAIVHMRPMGSIQDRVKTLKNSSLVIGKQVTYQHQGLTASGIPRFPSAIAIRDYE